MSKLRKFLLLLAFALLPLSGLAQQFESPAWQRQIYSTDSGLPQNTVHALLQSRRGYLYVATEGGLAQFDGQRFRIFTTDNSKLPSNDGHDLTEQTDGSIWLATAGGAARLWNGTVTAYGAEEGLGSPNVLRWATAGGNALLAVTSNGAYRWNGSRWEASLSPPPPERRPSPQQLSAGLDPQDPLMSAGILCRLRDREGNVWLGTESSGLAVLRRSRFTLIGTRQGLSSEAVRCVFQTRDGALWFGSSDAGLDRLYQDRWTHLTTANGLSSNVIIALGEDGQGNLLAGTPDGLNRIHDQTIEVLTSSDGLADDFVRSLAYDGEDLYIGTRRGLTQRRTNGETRTYTVADGLPSDLIGALLPVSPGDLWIGTLQGLVHRAGGAFSVYTAADSLHKNTVTAVYRDSTGVIWIGTQGGSLYRFSGNHMEAVKANGLPSNVFGIGEDAAGSLWLSSNTGLYRANRNDLLRGRGEAVAYGTADGLRLNEGSVGGAHPTVWHAKDGSLWFATPRGAACIRPEQARLNTVPPPVVIESLTLDDRRIPVENEGKLAVAPGPTRYAFEYTAPSFIASQKIRFRYRLEGFDRAWVEAGSRRTAFYTNLPPGHYSFHVQARNADGLWNRAGSSLPLVLHPPFYRTLWFYALCAAAFGGLLYGAYRWRERRVRAGFDAVLAERTRIAREIHDTLAQGFAGISVQLEILSKLLGDSGRASSAAIREHLDDARILVRDSLTEARRSIWQLRSGEGNEQDLRERLGRLTSLASGHGGEPRITLDVQGAFRPLDPAVEAELLRIAQEAVRNAVRHARASSVRIALDFLTPGRVRLSVFDNGHGFDPAHMRGPDQGHWGVAGMRERAEAIGAALAVESSGDGTAVSVEVPSP